jgi:hypothetical protein
MQDIAGSGIMGSIQEGIFFHVMHGFESFSEILEAFGIQGPDGFGQISKGRFFG